MASLLVVEDHEIFVQSLVRLLLDRGQHDVKAVGSGDKALECLPGSHFDMVLVDVSLPDVNGIDLVRQIRQAMPALPCLMVSGYMAPHYVQQSLAAGARGYVLKEDIRGILDGIQDVLRGGTFISGALR